MNRLLTFAILVAIPVGGIAQTHMPGWRDSEHAEVVAGADVVEPALQKWGKANEITRLTTNADELINDPSIDIIDICTPNNYHTPLAVAALNARREAVP